MFKTTRVAGYATYVIALLAFALSYSKLFALAERAGYSPNMAHLWPLIVDGLAVVATLGVLRLRKSGYAWFLLIASTVVSVVAAVASAMFPAGALPPVAAALVSIVPPLCLLFAPHLAVQLIREAQEDDAATQVVAVDDVDPTDDDQDATNLESEDEAFNVEPTSLNAADVALDEQPTVAVAPIRREVASNSTSTVSELRAAQRSEALQLVANTDLSLREIAKKVGTTDMSVGRWAKAAGVDTRNRRKLQQAG